MEEAIQKLQEGKIGVIPTDTLYGLTASASNAEAVERIYRIKGRDDNKPFIVLVSSMDDLERFGAALDENVRDFLMNNWPAPLSVIVPVHGSAFQYLHRGTESLAFRMPDDEPLQKLLFKTGPLVAPSANPQGENPATTIEEAKRYFGDSIDFYIDGGTLESEPSTIVDTRKGKIEVVRAGAHEIR